MRLKISDRVRDNVLGAFAIAFLLAVRSSVALRSLWPYLPFVVFFFAGLAATSRWVRPVVAGRQSLKTRLVASTATALVVASMLAILYVAIGV
jgi:hypothetical protein